LVGWFSLDFTLLNRDIWFGDGDKLLRVFADGRSIRRAIIKAVQYTTAPDFGRGTQTDAPTDAKKGKAETR